MGILAAVFIGLWAALAGYVTGHAVAEHQDKKVMEKIVGPDHQ